MGLSNYQLILLDNLIYLDTITKFESGEEDITIEKVVDILLYKDGDLNNGAGTGTILQDAYDSYKGAPNENCMMTFEEWKQVLLAIKDDKVLCSLKIHKLKNDTESGFRAMALTGDNIDENVIIFRGTSTPFEWIDNGMGGYSVETPNQRQAMEFVNEMDIVDNKAFVVSGHSKGGNLAQHVALFSSNPPIDRCLSFDGQGFSEEACA